MIPYTNPHSGLRSWRPAVADFSDTCHAREKARRKALRRAADGPLALPWVIVLSVAALALLIAVWMWPR